MGFVPRIVVTLFGGGFVWGCGMSGGECGDVPEAVRESVAALTSRSGGEIERAFIVPSGAHENAHFIAALITRPGADEKYPVWLKTGDLEGPGVLLPVNGAAIEFSAATGVTSDEATATMQTPGAQEARSCLER
jgi:hypothetical protein